MSAPRIAWAPALPPVYLVVADYGRHFGVSCSGDLLATLGDATDAWVEARDDGLPARVWRLDEGVHGFTDATAEAAACLRERLAERGDEEPDWLAEGWPTQRSAA